MGQRLSCTAWLPKIVVLKILAPPRFRERVGLNKIPTIFRRDNGCTDTHATAHLEGRGRKGLQQKVAVLI
jgi:hypothetical protein